jgi:uncharacterized OB-fold protein
VAEPRPILDGLFETDGAGARLLAGRCTACAALHFPATPLCPYCGASADVARVGPRGTLRLFTSVRTAPPGYRGPVPYGFGVVELDGTGLCVLGRLAEADTRRLHPGQAVRLVIEPLYVDDEGHPVLSWLFAAEGSS